MTNPPLETSHELWHYFTEEECIEPTVKVRRGLTPVHTGNLLALEKRLLSQLLDLLAACKKSKPKLSTTTPTTTVLIDTTTTPDGSTTTPVATTTTDLIDMTTTPGERTFIWFDNQLGEQWSTDGLHPSLRTSAIYNTATLNIFICMYAYHSLELKQIKVIASTPPGN